MKKLIILLGAVAALNSSCTKTKDVDVTTIKNDTTTVVKNDTTTDTVYNTMLVGEWYNDSYTNLTPTFTQDTLTFAGINYPYLASSDSIYELYNGDRIGVFFGYQINAAKDTLTLESVAYGIIKYYKI